jgi:hypothetical protein
MRKEKPSKTARKVALNIVTLWANPGLTEILPAGIVDATATLLVESGAVSATAVQWSRSRKMISVYKAFDWMMPVIGDVHAERALPMQSLHERPLFHVTICQRFCGAGNNLGVASH